MPYRDGYEVRNYLTNCPDPQLVANAYALRSLVFRATYSAGYSADSRWFDAVIPTDVGAELMARVSTLPIPKSDLHLALFGLFWYEDLLVDPINSDLDLIRSIIEDEVASSRIYWPMIHGRYLYDRYAMQFGASRDSITGADTARLLQGSPAGVYQAGNYVTGPLGIIESEAVRHFPPQMVLGLWHCPMLDCGALHGVKIAPSPIPLVEAFAQLEKVAVQLWPTQSRWSAELSSWKYTPSEAWRAYSEMPLFLGDCVLREERRLLLQQAFESPYADGMRQILAAKAPRKERGSAEAVVAGLNEYEQLQLLLTMSDSALKRFIDELVWNGQIVIPVSEVREVDQTKRALINTILTMNFELSSLGIRDLRHSPILVLRHLLLKAHADDGDIADLDWRLRKPPGQSTQDALMMYLQRAKPLNAIDTLVLASPRVTNEVANALETTVEVPNERARALIAWKLGFDLPREDRRPTMMQLVFDNLHETLLRIAVPNGDADRQAIRAAGVNAFVELEGLLDEVVSYVVWMLQSDHPKETHFVYSGSIASKCVAETLGDELRSGNDFAKWSTSGNTLGTSLRYFQRLKEWIAELPAMDRSTLLRGENAVHARSSDNPLVFPFRHVQLWADASPDGLAGVAAVVTGCADILGAADVAGIRNSLEHYREPERFPATNRILDAVVAVRSFIALAGSERLLPKLYWFSGESTDAFGQRVITMVDHKNDVYLLRAPRTVVGLLPWSSIASPRPVLIAPGNLFGLPNSDILFRARQESLYSTYWNGYPARRDAVLVVPDDRTGREPQALQ